MPVFDDVFQNFTLSDYNIRAEKIDQYIEFPFNYWKLSRVKESWLKVLQHIDDHSECMPMIRQFKTFLLMPIVFSNLFSCSFKFALNFVIHSVSSFTKCTDLIRAYGAFSSSLFTIHYRSKSQIECIAKKKKLKLTFRKTETSLLFFIPWIFGKLTTLNLPLKKLPLAE